MKKQYPASKEKYKKLFNAFTQVTLLMSVILSYSIIVAAEPTSIDSSAKTICKELEKIRGLVFKSPVTIEPQALEALNAYIEKEIVREFGKDKGEAYISALVKLGVLKEEINLSSVYSTLARAQVVAHYDPESKKYFLIMTNLPPEFIEVVSSHELCHALQDQHFNLNKFLKTDTPIHKNGDKSMAKHCLVEGEATLVMTTWLLMKKLRKNNPEDVAKHASLSVTMMSSMDPVNIMKLSCDQLETAGVNFPNIESIMDELSELPLFFVYTLYASYAQGACMVNHARQAGGWGKINDLYQNPPTSTEQILHPEKLLENREEPVDVQLSELNKLLDSGWSTLEENTLGELGIIIFFHLWLDNIDLAKHAATGWGGDRYSYSICKKTGKYLLVWKTVWDTASDATEFSVAYRAMLNIRFPLLKKISSSHNAQQTSQLWEIEPGRMLKLVRRGKEVVIMDSTAPDVLEQLLSNSQ